MAMTASRPPRRTGGSAMADVFAFASRAGALTALCIASAFFAVPKAEADIVVRFFDTGSNESAAEASGSFDLSGYSSSLPRGVNNLIGAEVAGNRDVTYWIVATGGNSSPYRAPNGIALQRRALVDYSGKTNLQSNLGSFSGDFRISTQYKILGSNSEWNIGVDLARVDNNNIASFSNDRVTYRKSLQDLLGDTDFHVEFIFGTQKVIYTTKMPPAKPEGLKATAGSAKVTLAWDDQSDDANVGSWQYRQRPNTSNSWGSWTEIKNSGKNTTTHTVTTGLTDGTTYRFQIRAVGFGFVGAESDEVTATPNTVPSRPTIHSVVPGRQLIRVTVTALPDATSWQARCRTENGTFGSWAGARDAADPDNSDNRVITISSLTDNTPYICQVRALNGTVEGMESAETTSATPHTEPPAPADFAADPGNGKATLRWTDPENDNITGYEYAQKTDGDYGPWIPFKATEVAGSNVLRHTVTRLTNGTQYTFRLRAVTVAYKNARFNEATATPAVVPGEPQGFRLEPGNRTIKLVWNDQSDDPVTIVRWQYMEKIGDAAWPSAWTDISPSDKDTTSLTLDRLTNGTVYGYRIRAVATGNLYGERSDDRFATPAGPPVAATLTATAGARRVTLSWTLAADASIQKWQYQKLQGTATNASDFANVAWDEIEGSGAATRSHTVRDLEGDVTYSFRVRAIGYGGDGVASDIATATAEPGPSVEEEKRVLKRTLAAVAQATVAGAADTIGQRFDAGPGSRSLTLAGRQVGGSYRVPETAATAAGPRAGVASDPRIAGGGAYDDVERRVGNSSYEVDGDALLRGSAFTLSLAGENAGAGGPDWTVWGRGDWRTFEGRKSGDRWDGKQWTGWLGVDGRLNERLMAGVALSRGESEADYRLKLDEEFEGRLETSLTALWPYLQMKAAGGGAVRLVLGAGTGKAEHRKFDGEVEKADLSLLAGSVSGRLPVARRSAFTLSAIGGASLAQIETDGPSSTSIGGLTATSWRLNAGMEAEHDGFALASSSDWQVRPRGALELRQDGGDGVTGSGMEISGGVRMSAPGSRFGLDASGHWLALHAEDDTRERGASLEARLNPAADGRGLSLALGPAWGQQQHGALASERLFDEASDDDAPEHLSLTARAGYGVAAAGGLLTPFTAMAFSGESHSQHYRTGIGFARGGIDAALTAGHRAGGAPDTRISLDLRLHY